MPCDESPFSIRQMKPSSNNTLLGGGLSTLSVTTNENTAFQSHSLATIAHSMH